MNPQETIYHDYLLGLSSGMAASSYTNIVNNAPVYPEELTYVNYYNTLSAADKVESEYLIFSSLFDIIDVLDHEEYVVAFGAYGHDLEPLCKRKKRPAH